MAGALNLSAPAKLNLSLRVIGRRDDGMHLLDGEMTLISLADEVRLSARTDRRLARDWTHDEVPAAEDLAMRAAALFRQRAGCAQRGATIQIEKHIPVGGGLGGASADAAAVLLGLNRLWEVGWGAARLLELARTLGADVPFFIVGRRARVGGVGDVITPVAAPGPGRAYLLVFPEVVALTRAVFAAYRRLTPAQRKEKLPPSLADTQNDLTQAAIKCYPEIIPAAEALHRAAGQARLSGSGATLFAVFENPAAAAAKQALLPPQLRSAVVKDVVKDLENRPLIGDNPPYSDGE